MGKNKVMIIVIIALLVVLLATIVGVTIYTIKTIKGSEDPNLAVKETLKQENIQTVPVSDSIYTNLRDGEDGNGHVIRVKISLGIDITDSKESTKLIEMLSAKEVVTKDVILGILRDKTFEDMKKTDSREILKNDILTKLQETFDSNLIVKIYIDDMFVQ